jgi:exonuclease SbcC
LQGEQQIDWEQAPLKGEGLFIITGPTGSGKSTLLDIMTLALYNRIARLPAVSASVIENTGSIVTHGCDDAFAEITYQCSKGTFRSRWSIEKNKKGAFGDYKMELWAVADNQKLESQSSKVQRFNEEAIGLDFVQFSRAIMLAQGDFAQLLKAKKNERSELLEKITGTRLYSELGKKCFEIESQIRQQLKELTLVLSSYRLLDEQERKTKEQELQDLKRKKTTTDFQFSTLEKNILVLQKHQEASLKVLQLESESKSADTEQTVFKAEKLNFILVYERLMPLADTINKFHTLSELIRTLQQQELEAEAQVTLLEQNKENWKLAISQFVPQLNLQQEPTNQLIAFRDLVLEQEKELQTWRSKESDLKERLRITFDKTREQFKSLFSADSNVLLSNFQAHHSQISKQLAEVSATLEAEWKTDPEKSLEFFRKRETGLLRLLDRIKDFEVKREEGKQLLVKKSETQEIVNQKILEFEKFRLLSESLSNQLGQFRSILEKQKLSKSLEAHRKNLTVGEPCPLCGSKEHPYVQHYQELVDDLQLQLNATEKDWKKATEEEKLALQYKSTNEQLLKSTVDEILTNDRVKKSLVEEINSIKTEYGFDFNYSESPSWPSQELKISKQKIEQLTSFNALGKQVKSIEEIVNLLMEFTSCSNQVKQLMIRNQNAYSGASIGNRVDELLKEWNVLSEKLRNTYSVLETVKKQLPADTNRLLILQRELTEKLEEAGFASLEDALASKISEEEYLGLQKQFHDIKVRASVSLQRLLEARKELEQHHIDGIEGDLELLTQRLNELKVQRELLLKESGALEHELDVDAQNHVSQKRQLLELADKTKEHKRWEKLNALIGDREGRKFRNFAQKLTLQQLLWHANGHLLQLHDRYEFEMPSDLTREEELRIIDKHLANTTRAVSTLSGGETFLASLALALGLSDMAAKNANLECLFIDEGFGTLDSETLEIAINTLEHLRVEKNKVIGIISHIDALKERIPVKIQVNRNLEGFSTIKISR